MNLLTAVLRLDRLDKNKESSDALTSLFTLQDWEDLADKKSNITKVFLCLQRSLSPLPPNPLPSHLNPVLLFQDKAVTDCIGRSCHC